MVEEPNTTEENPVEEPEAEPSDNADDTTPDELSLALAKIAEQESTITALNSQLSEKDGEIARLKSAMYDMTQTPIETVNADIETSDITIDDLFNNPAAEELD